MAKKALVFLVAFILLAGINYYIAVKVIYKSVRARSTEQILEEIADTRTQTTDTQFTQTSAPLVMGAFSSETEITPGDGRAANLKAFFRKHNSPLYDKAEFIVATSDKYQLDYRLLPAIAMQESNLCRVIPDNSYNCWGWGIYGTTITRFESYEEAIETVAKGLKKNYIDNGLVTASAIMQKYTPSSNGSWAHGVNTFLEALQ